MKKSTIALCISLLIAVLTFSCSTDSTPVYQLTTSAEPPEAGNITQSASEVEEGETIQITANSNEHWVFDRWSGDYSGSENPASIVMDQDKTITAIFDKRDYPLTINIEGEGTVDERVIQAKTTDYPHDTVVELTANPAEGWEFIEWSGDVNSVDDVIEIDIEGDTNVTVTFERMDYPLSITIEGEGEVEQEIVSTPKTTEYPYETVVELTAVPNDGWKFVEWQGDLSGNENPEIITIEEEVNVTAVFEIAEYVLDISIDGQASLSIDPEKDVYRDGDHVVITVEGENDWNFVHWEGDLDGNENPIELTITSDITATAIMHQSPFEGGNGSEDYPYQISTIEQLQEVRNYTDRHFLQINDIDASETKNWNGGEGFRPIGDSVLRFTGKYNGNHKQIINLNINSGNQIGLFGFTDDAKLIDVHLRDVKIFSSGGTVGGLISFSSGSKIINSSVHGEITSMHGVVGGLIGYGTNNTIKNSSMEGYIFGLTGVGGLVGYNGFSHIESSYSIVHAESESSSTGGLVGHNEGGSIVNSYSQGKVSGGDKVGGLIGLNEEEAKITNSYSSVLVNGNDDIGALIGLNGGNIVSSFWDVELNNHLTGVGRGSSDGVTGLITSEMQGSAAQENMPEFDWDDVWITTDGYPILRWQVE